MHRDNELLRSEIGALSAVMSGSVTLHMRETDTSSYNEKVDIQRGHNRKNVLRYGMRHKKTA